MTDFIRLAMILGGVALWSILFALTLGWLISHREPEVAPEDTDEPWGNITIIPEGSFFGGPLTPAEAASLKEV